MARQESDKYASKDDIDRLNNFMALVVIVLFVGFILLLGTVAEQLVTSIKDDSTSRDQLIQQVQQLNNKLNK